MTEQQNHLRELLKQAEEIKVEINNLNAQAQAKKDLLLRALGAIEYLQQIGVTLPEEGEAAPASEAVEEAAAEEPAVEPEVVEESPAEG